MKLGTRLRIAFRKCSDDWVVFRRSSVVEGCTIYLANQSHRENNLELRLGGTETNIQTATGGCGNDLVANLRDVAPDTWY